MSSTGELDIRVRRPSTPGKDTQILFNSGGVDGANANLTFDDSNNVLAVGGTPNTTTYSIGGGRTVVVLQGNPTGNDVQVAFQNSTSFVGGYLYSTNTEMRIAAQVGSTCNIYGGARQTISVIANQANVNGSLNVTATSGGGTKVLEVIGANSTGSLAIFDSGGNFGSYLIYRANSADVGIIGSGSRVFASRNNDFAITASNVGGNLMLGTQTTCYMNITPNQVNVAGNINCTANIANTGNLLVTQNTFTGNLSVTTLANIATLNCSTSCNTAALNVSGTANIAGLIPAAGSPTTNNQTRAITGLCAITQSVMSITSNTTLSTDLNLRCDINETGIYKIDGWLGFYHTTSAIANLKITLGGTATINNMMMGMMCSQGAAGANGAAQSNTATAGNTGLSQANANVQICNIASITQNQPDFVVLSGILVANATGTLIPMWAQAVSAASAMNRSANSYFMLTKIG